MHFERAVETGNPNIVIAAAHELPRPVLLRDALRVSLVLAVADSERYQPASAPFGARFVAERRLSVLKRNWHSLRCRRSRAESQIPGGEALCALLEQHGEPEGAGYLAEWLRETSR